MNIEEIAFEEFKNVGDDGLFPNHTDKDIWIAGFKAGYSYLLNKIENTKSVPLKEGNTKGNTKVTTEKITASPPPKPPPPPPPSSIIIREKFW